MSASTALERMKSNRPIRDAMKTGTEINTPEDMLATLDLMLDSEAHERHWDMLEDFQHITRKNGRYSDKMRRAVLRILEQTPLDA